MTRSDTECWRQLQRDQKHISGERSIPTGEEADDDDFRPVEARAAVVEAAVVVVDALLDRVRDRRLAAVGAWLAQRQSSWYVRMSCMYCIVWGWVGTRRGVGSRELFLRVE